MAQKIKRYFHSRVHTVEERRKNGKYANGKIESHVIPQLGFIIIHIHQQLILVSLEITSDSNACMSVGFPAYI